VFGLDLKENEALSVSELQMESSLTLHWTFKCLELIDTSILSLLIAWVW
jgi:hypothetical protein